MVNIKSGNIYFFSCNLILDIHECICIFYFYFLGVTQVCVFNSEEALKLLNIGRKHLSIASTKMNYQSSRRYKSII